MRKSKLLRYVLIIIAGLYLVTWVWGIPAVHTSVAASVIKNYKDLLKRPETRHYVSPHHPRLQFSATFVPLPFAFVSWHERQTGGLMGWGGMKVYLWCPGHVLEIAKWTAWLS